jgi:2'-5' RNA ligase
MKINFVSLLFFVLSFVRCVHAAEFVPHTLHQPMQSYLSMNLPYRHYQELLQYTEQQEDIHLLNRGEAHITVISPVEYDSALKRHLSIEEIHEIAERAGIQKTPFEEICIGRGQKILQGRPEKTYFVVVQSEGLVKLRQLIAEAFVAHGGHPQDFHPEIFYPHVTLGYTARDLHFEDGVIKNKSTCIHALPLANH